MTVQNSSEGIADTDAARLYTCVQRVYVSLIQDSRSYQPAVLQRRRNKRQRSGGREGGEGAWWGSEWRALPVLHSPVTGE